MAMVIRRMVYQLSVARCRDSQGRGATSSECSLSLSPSLILSQDRSHYVVQAGPELSHLAEAYQGLGVTNDTTTPAYKHTLSCLHP